MSSRLNNAIRRSIRESLMSEVFDGRQAQLDRQEAQLAFEARTLALGKHSDQWNAMPSDLLALDNVMRVSVGGQFHLLRDTKEKHRAFAPTVFPARPLRLDAANEFGQQVQAWADELRQLGEERKALRHKVDGILNSVTTTKKLAEVWPEIRPHIPAAESTGKALAPVNQVNDFIHDLKRKAQINAI